MVKFLSTPSARRATTGKRLMTDAEGISIHALREEGDAMMLCVQTVCGYFYPRPPRGGRPARSPAPPKTSPFLSTPSARRATHCCDTDSITSPHFYPRPPRGGRPLHRVRQLPGRVISIHALREEGDLALKVGRGHAKQFLSTPSARRATAKTEKASPLLIKV